MSRTGDWPEERVMCERMGMSARVCSRADLKRVSMSSVGFHILGTPCSSYLNRSSKLLLVSAYKHRR